VQEESVTFDDLILDDTIDDLQRIVRYSSSRIALQRLVHVKLLSSVVGSFPLEEFTAAILPLLEPLTQVQNKMRRRVQA
jgi:serine/threonine-protein phosphatase 4 regulatory subunit 1